MRHIVQLHLSGRW